LKSRAERVLQKARDRNVGLGQTVSGFSIAQFEREHGIQLPQAYTAFLQFVGNGNEGPYDSATLYFYDPLRESQLRTDLVRFDPNRISLPFPFTTEWIWEGGEESAEGSVDDLNNGNLLIADVGCGIEWRLILSGSQAGNIWQFCDVGIIPTVPRRDFLAWFEGWLDGEPWHPGISDG
jgi:hypothetical protein